MKSFDDVFKEKFPDLVDAISCGDLIAKNYKVAINEGFDLCAQSRQSEIDELKRRIGDALKVLNDASPTMLNKKAVKILKGAANET